MPPELGFQPRSTRYGPFLVSGLFDTNTAHFGPLLATFGPFPGYIVELEGDKGLLVRGQPRSTWTVAIVPLRLSVLTWFRGRFGPERAALGHKMRTFGRAPPDLAPPPRGATAKFMAENLDLARPPPRL